MAMAMAPPRLPLPELNDDLTGEILLRVRPDEPASLFRAPLVCKPWLRILSDPNFRRRYLAFHQGSPPLLGFFYNCDFPGPFSRFVATTASSPIPRAAPAHEDRRVSWALDCRHGRVLFKKTGTCSGLVVCDPVADSWNDLPAPPDVWYTSYSVVVLCDVAGCDHRDCRGGRFLVVCVDFHDYDRTLHACVYSSEDGAWRAPVSDDDLLRSFVSIDRNRAVLVGDGIYCTLNRGARILKYDLAEHSFSLIDCPYLYRRVPVLMQNEDGSLGLAGVRGSTLCLWSTRCNHEAEGAVTVKGWVQWRVIKLRKVLPVDDKPCLKANVIGFAEGVGVFFVSTTVSVFTVELKSGRVKMVSRPRKNLRNAFPLISFFTPDYA